MKKGDYVVDKQWESVGSYYIFVVENVTDEKCLIVCNTNGNRYKLSETEQLFYRIASKLERKLRGKND